MQKCRVKRHSVVQPLDKPYRFIPLTQGQNAIVDVEDFEWLSQRLWYAAWSPITKSFYAVSGLRGLKMHRLILGCIGRQEQGDHRNHDTLDNRKGNLRKCTNAENCRNHERKKKSSSGYKGAVWHKRILKWQANIRVNRKLIHLGYFESKKRAAEAYDIAARTYFGEFAHLNFPTMER